MPLAKNNPSSLSSDPLHAAFPKTRLNRSLRILIAASAILTFALGLFGPFYAVYVQNIGGSIAVAGFSWGIFGVVTGALTLLFARLELHVKEQELLIALGYLLRGLVFFSYAFMGGIAQLILTQIVWGLAAAIGVPAFDAVYAAHTEKKHSVAQWGSWEGVISISSGIAAIAGGVLIETFGFQIVFLTIATVCTLLSLYIWHLPRKVL